MTAAFERIPAIDLRGGRAVRLRQGDPNRETSYSDDPVALAASFAAAGARSLHVVDLDGAFAGRPAHLDVVAQIAAETGLPVRLGGGLRERRDVDAALASGVAVAILGTVWVERPAEVEAWARELPGRLAAGLDVRDGSVRTRGWASAAALSVEEAAERLRALGITDVVVTDALRDGELSGPDVPLFRRAAAALGFPVIAAGGIASVDDLRLLAAEPGVRGAVLGRSLYEGRIPLDALRGDAA